MIAPAPVRSHDAFSCKDGPPNLTLYHEDLNPIGAISKTDLRKFIVWAKDNFDLPVLDEFTHAIPTAELVPFSNVIQEPPKLM